MVDELDAPLTRRGARPSAHAAFARARRNPWARAAVAVAIVAVAIPSIWIVVVDDPEGGRPMAEVEVAPAAPDRDFASAVTLDVGEELAREPGPEAEVDSSAAIPQPDEVLEIAGLPVGDDPFGALPDLVEESPHGPIPHLGPGGEKAADIYARASVGPGAAAGRPRIALLISGLGLSAQVTHNAITTLPDNVTLAFAPYGDDVSELARVARQGGHEIMLQVPMEPFDYPDNDPGPQTLLTGQPARANLDRLYWLMSRIGAYTGLVNYMGARFTASAVDFAPIVEEIGLRGLSYVDDGTSNRSLAPQMARQNGVDFARADLVVDREPSRAAILDQLEELEAVATLRGTAIGFASALPVSIRTIAEWAHDLEDRGMLLVPVSALAAKQRQQ